MGERQSAAAILQSRSPAALHCFFPSNLSLRFDGTSSSSNGGPPLMMP